MVRRMSHGYKAFTATQHRLPSSAVLTGAFWVLNLLGREFAAPNALSCCPTRGFHLGPFSPWQAHSKSLSPE